jgi:hypothetical protein
MTAVSRMSNGLVPPAQTVCRSYVRLTRSTLLVSPNGILHAFTCGQVPLVEKLGIATRKWLTNCVERSVGTVTRLLSAGSVFRIPA